MYQISEVTFIFLTKIYYNMNFITLPSNFIARFPWHFKISLRRLLLENNFKELRILLKCREAFEKFIAACNSSKTTGLSSFLNWSGAKNYLNKFKRLGLKNCCKAGGGLVGLMSFTFLRNTIFPEKLVFNKK